MLPHQKIPWPCPYCEKETLLVLWWPSHKEARISRSAVAKSTTLKRKKEGLILLSEKCANCGKPAKEIERKWAELGW